MFDTTDHIPMQRARGKARLGVVQNGTGTKLSDLHQSGCLKLMLPRNHAAVPDAVLINTAGGLTGGDELTAQVSVGDHASLRLSTQTAERIYQSTGDAASVRLEFTLGEKARLDWLAQETILFDGGRINRRLEASIASDASLLIVEPIVLGRAAMGETITNGLIHDQWRIKRGEALVFADATKLDDFEALRKPAAIGEAQSLVSLLFVDALAETKLDDLRVLCGREGWHAGVSAWNGQLLLRGLAKDARLLRERIKDAIKIIRGPDLPRVWTM